MRNLMTVAFLTLLLHAASPRGFAQLRNLSEYSQDRINTDQTHFILHDTGAADYTWTSEWTHMSANAYPDKSAMFVWHFKDGTKAYSRQGEHIGDSGMYTGYLLTSRSPNLEDIHGKSIQPMTRDNHPVKVELWIGEIGNTTGFSPETLVDAVCLDARTIEYNQPYQFANCQ